MTNRRMIDSLAFLFEQGFRSSFGRASYLSLLVQIKVTQRKHTPAMRSPGIRQLLLHCSTSGIHAVACLPTSRSCRGVRRRHVRVLTSNWRASCAPKQGKGKGKGLPRRSPRMDGFMDYGAVRGAEHRRRSGKKPEGLRRWIAAIAKQYMDVLSERPHFAEKRRGFCCAEAQQNTALGA